LEEDDILKFFIRMVIGNGNWAVLNGNEGCNFGFAPPSLPNGWSLFFNPFRPFQHF
jgi:hypothetical protein